MKKFFSIVMLLSLVSCGYSAKNSEMIGQVKSVTNETPILCNERNDVDISLGVLRNGVGSMSAEDVFLTISNEKDLAVLKEANESGKLVKVVYDFKRWTWCWNQRIVKSVEIVQ